MNNNQINTMCLLVSDYIFMLKDIRVKVTPKPNKLNLLVLAYNKAMWFFQNKCKKID